MVAPSLMCDTADIRTAIHENVGISVCTGAATLEIVEAMQDMAHQLWNKNPDPLLLFFVGEKAEFPDGEVRTACINMFRQMDRHLKIISTVLEGHGFLAAAKRSVYAIAGQSQMPHVHSKVFYGIGEACAWLVGEAKTRQLKAPAAADLEALLGKMARRQ